MFKDGFESQFLCASLHFSSLQSCGGSGGSTDLWRPLRSLSLLPPCRGARNMLLLSDGHVQNQPLTLQLVRENSCHTRLFTCGLGSALNKSLYVSPTVAERAQCAATSENTNAPANQENIFISLTADGANAHNTNT